MTVDIAKVLGILTLAIFALSIPRVPVHLAALTVVGAIAATGALPAREAFGNFAHPTVVFIYALLAMTQGMVATGLTEPLGRRIAAFARFGERTFIAALMLVVAGFSSLVSNTVTTAAFLPVVIAAARRAGVPVERVLLPLAYASMLGGTIFLYGTSTNLVVSAAMVEDGLAPLGFAELTKLGVPLAALGILLVVLLAPKLLRVRGANDEAPPREYRAEALLTEGSPWNGRTVEELGAELGLQVTRILRRDATVGAAPKLVLETGDRVMLAGEREQILGVKAVPGIDLKPELALAERLPSEPLPVVAEAMVAPGSQLEGRSLREMLFSDRFGLLALALHRGPRRGWHALPHDVAKLADVPLEVGDVLLLRGSRRRLSALRDERDMLILSEQAPAAMHGWRALGAVGIFVATLAVAALDVLPQAAVGLAGVLLMVATGLLSARRALRVDWRVLVLIGAMLSLGDAVYRSGAGGWVGALATKAAGPFGPAGVLCALMLVTIALSAPMSNQAAALVVLPIAVSTAQALGLEPRPFAIGIALAASLSFVTPFEPSCVMVYRPGRYRFGDFLRLGLPITLILVLLLTFGVPHLWPFATR